MFGYGTNENLDDLLGNLQYVDYDDVNKTVNRLIYLLKEKRKEKDQFKYNNEINELVQLINSYEYSGLIIRQLLFYDVSDNFD